MGFIVNIQKESLFGWETLLFSHCDCHEHASFQDYRYVGSIVMLLSIYQEISSPGWWWCGEGGGIITGTCASLIGRTLIVVAEAQHSARTCILDASRHLSEATFRERGAHSTCTMLIGPDQSAIYNTDEPCRASLPAYWCPLLKPRATLPSLESVAKSTLQDC